MSRENLVLGRARQLGNQLAEKRVVECIEELSNAKADTLVSKNDIIKAKVIIGKYIALAYSLGYFDGDKKTKPVKGLFYASTGK